MTGKQSSSSMITPPQVPVVFGHWLVEGNKLVCRLPRKTITVNAPKKLLLQIMRYCDGSLSWAEAIERLSSGWDIHALTTFLHGLVRDGVLVEASQLWAHWGELAQLPATTAIATTAKDMGALHQAAERRLLNGLGMEAELLSSRRSHFAALLAKRQSTRTFDDMPVSAECLCSVLWAAHGVTRPGDDAVTWHRTIASGGNMHSARWFVVVLRELPAQDKQGKPLAPGIYEARFHRLGGASFHKADGPVSSEVTDAWRCLRDPRVLRFASALIFPVYDISVPGQKYGNRATLFAMVEAGQALQNAQLMAFELGASGMLRGDTISHASLDMLGLKNDSAHWFVVPAMVLGSQATVTQLKQQQTENVLKIAPNLRLQDESFAFSATPSAPDQQGLFAASGRSRDPRLALTKAEAEAWERLAWVSPANLETARIAEMPGALDPRELLAYSERQYARPDFPCLPFSARRQYLWSQAIDTASGRTCPVLADLVYAHSALPQRFQKTAFASASTSGMAAGISKQDALCRATLELIERDAFVCAWLGRTPRPAIRSRSLPGSAARRIAELTLAGFRIVVSDISTGWAPVVSVFAQTDQPPLTVIAAAADFSAEQALEKALDEIEGRIAQARYLPLPAADDADPMRQIERFYRSRRTYKRSDFYFENAGSRAFGAVGSQASKNWEQLQSCILRDKFRLLAIEMTPHNASMEQGRVPLQVARAVVPGLVPIWFQKGLQPEGMPRFIKSVGDMEGKHTSRFFVHPFT